MNALLRRRTLLLVLLPLGALFSAEPRPLPYLLGLAAAVAGESIRLWSTGHIVKAVELTRTGPYAYVRNPLYLGSLLITCGWGLMSGRVVVTLVLLAAFSLTHGLAIRSEERYLGERFGAEFEEYRRRVPRLLPTRRPLPERIGNYSFRRAIQCDGEGMSALAVLVLAFAYATRFWWW